MFMLFMVKYGMTTFTLYCGQHPVKYSTLCLKFQFLVTVMRDIMASTVCSKIMPLFLTYRCKIAGCNGLCVHIHGTKFFL